MVISVRKVKPLGTEKRPTNPVKKGPRPGSRTHHRVRNNETFETVAKLYGVSVNELLMHNFGTLEPRELNWYLREHVGCNLPTPDRMNWRFSESADPGLIYIPQHVIRLDTITIMGRLSKSPRLDDPTNPFVPASDKFSYEFKIPSTGPPVELGYFQAEASVGVEGELKQESGIYKTSLKKDQIKISIEKKISEDTKQTFSLTQRMDEEKSLKLMAKALESGSKRDFAKAIGINFEWAIKTTYKWTHISVDPEFGLEFSMTPVIIRVTGAYEDYLMYEGSRFKGKFGVKLGMKVGLSAKGRAWFIENVGRPALTTLAEWLGSEAVLTAGIVAVGTVVGTVALVSLMAWVVQDASHKGELAGLATWYTSSYTAIVFERPYWREMRFTSNPKLQKELQSLGEKDALIDARSILTKMKDPAARGTDQQALDAYRMLLIHENKGSEENARIKLRLALEEKSKRLVGL